MFALRFACSRGTAVDVMIKGSKLRYGNVGELNTRGLRTGKSQPDDYDDDDDDDDDDEYSCVFKSLDQTAFPAALLNLYLDPAP